MGTTGNDPVITSYAKAPARTITAGDVTYAYRELGPKGGIPVIFFVHLAATLDNWDPRIIDPIAREHHVIAFDNRGVGASTGNVPDTIEEAADDAYAFITALGFDKVDIFAFSMGGMIAQDLVLKHPDLVRKLVLTGTGPRGGKDMDKVVGTTYWDILRATLTRSDPKEFLFFNRNATGKPAAKAFVNRLKERTVDRDESMSTKGFRTQLKAIQRYGRSTPSDLSTITQPTLIANGDNDRMVPSALSEDLHRRISGLRAHHLPRLRPRRHLPVPRHVRPRRRRVPRPLTASCEGRQEKCLRHVPLRRSPSPHRSCCGCAPTSPVSKAWTTGRARTRRSSPRLRGWRSTARSTWRRTIPACGRPSAASRRSSRPSAGSTASPRSRSRPFSPRCVAVNRPGSRTRMK